MGELASLRQRHTVSGLQAEKIGCRDGLRGKSGAWSDSQCPPSPVRRMERQAGGEQTRLQKISIYTDCLNSGDLVRLMVIGCFRMGTASQEVGLFLRVSAAMPLTCGREVLHGIAA